MKQRIISVAVLLAIVAVCIPFFCLRVIFFCVGGMLCAYEYSKNLESHDIHITLWVMFAYLAVTCFLTLTKCGLMTYIAWFVAGVYAALFSGIIHSRVSGKGAVYTVSAMAYPCFPFALIMFISGSARWAETLALGCFSCWLCDAFALFGGMLFGKHRIAPEVSPKKTVEGCVTGAVFSLLGGVIVFLGARKWGISEIPLHICLITAFVSSTLGQIGDLAESLLKRYLGIKDFSNLIPGHGGMFDRADSLLFSIPAAYFCLYLFGF